ncbi:hypothetical protein [Microbacterium sp. CH1]|uniref:hypothetical protein n=1 Tax=Microbacterium sp. CH1 TaxID=1770208 RepID=UPI0007875FAF|nr:hypothetical protein [Microbacterium sp. CH1]KYJ99334.1 hypothetical protein AUV07_10925 [Microbacterium sp. CH1]
MPASTPSARSTTGADRGPGGVPSDPLPVGDCRAGILRDDIDEIRRSVKATDSRLYGVEQTQNFQARDILGIREEIGQIRTSERDQWDAIETTADKRRQNPGGTP